MPVDLAARDWLIDLVEEELDRFDPEAEPAWLPAELLRAAADKDLAPGTRMLVARSLRLRKLDPGDDSPEATFVEEVRGHLGLVLDLAVLAGEPWQRHRGRIELAAALAGALDEHGLALAAHATRDHGGAPHEVAAALRAAGRAPEGPLLPARATPSTGCRSTPAPGPPSAGTWPGWSWGSTAPAGSRPRRSTATAPSPSGSAPCWPRRWPACWPPPPRPPGEQMAVLRRRQLGRLGLPGPRLRDARRAVAAPRAPGALALAAPPLDAPLPAGAAAPRPACAPACRPSRRPGSSRPSAPRPGSTPRRWWRRRSRPRPSTTTTWPGSRRWPAPARTGSQLAAAWEETSDEVVERISDAVSTNYDALTTGAARDRRAGPAAGAGGGRRHAHRRGEAQGEGAAGRPRQGGAGAGHLRGAGRACCSCRCWRSSCRSACCPAPGIGRGSGGSAGRWAAPGTAAPVLGLQPSPPGSGPGSGGVGVAPPGAGSAAGGSAARQSGQVPTSSW